MKPLVIAWLLTLGIRATAEAQFSSGSTGAYGPLDITTNTHLAMPDDGIFHCTTINVAADVTLSFQKNSRNTPVYLLATGDVTISGLISVSGGGGTSNAGGIGGPGGFDGGSPGFAADQLGGNGLGPGGGKPGGAALIGGHGVYRTAPTASPSNRDGEPYGSRLLIPLVGGSGGGGTFANGEFYGRKGGGGGGGAIMIASNTKISVNSGGIIRAKGGPGPTSNFAVPFGAFGSGGAVRLVAPQVGGSGVIDVSSQASGTGAFGSSGRSRIDTLDRRALNIFADSVGGVMFVFPEPLPKLSVTSAAGNPIPEGATAPIDLFLPVGTSPSQTITIRARDFGQSLPIRLSLCPESGDAIIYDTTIDNAAANPADATVNVVLPVNQQVRLQVWTR